MFFSKLLYLFKHCLFYNLPRPKLWSYKRIRLTTSEYTVYSIIACILADIVACIHTATTATIPCPEPPVCTTIHPPSTCPTCGGTSTPQGPQNASMTATFPSPVTEHTHSDDTPLSMGKDQQSYTVIAGLGAPAVVLALTLVGVVLGWVWRCRRNKDYQER